jgi:diguanylate cyclase (GGDEF)-like protein
VARALISFFFPEGLLFFTAMVLAASGLAVQAAPALIGLAPVVIWVAGILIGWRFNRSRLVFALVVLALANQALLLLGRRPDCGHFVHQATSLLVPLNLLGIFLIRERGIMGGWGLGRLLAILLQPLALAALYLTFPAAMAAFFDYPLLTFPFLKSAPLPQPALLAFGTALLLFWLSLLRRRGILENGFFWATLTAGTGLLVLPGPQAPVYFGMAGLILIVAVIDSVYSMAFRDELTGLPARRALNEAMMRLRGKYAVAMLDIDYFKKFNDTYGHDVGDQALCMVAAKMGKVGGGGRAFRYGGEEFTILFPGKSAREAAFFLEELRQIIATAGFIIRGKNRPRIKPKKLQDVRGSRQKVSITVSIGVAGAGGRTPEPQEVLEAADQALYRAKKMGRNQVVC